jgi:hypothetical protein
VSRSAAHWCIVATAFVALLGMVAMRWLLSPSPLGYGTHEQLGLPPCRTIDWIGIPCPGCGVTTSVTWFAHAQPWNSLVTQPFGFLIALVATCGLPASLIATLFGIDLGRVLTRVLVTRWWIWATLIVAAAWLYKIVVVVAR